MIMIISNNKITLGGLMSIVVLVFNLVVKQLKLVLMV